MLSGAITVAKGKTTIIGEYVVRDYLPRLITSGFTFTHIRTQNKTASSSRFFSSSHKQTHTHTHRNIWYMLRCHHTVFSESDWSLQDFSSDRH